MRCSPVFHLTTAVSMYICNENVYGFVMVPLDMDETVAEDLQRLTNIKTEILCK